MTNVITYLAAEGEKLPLEDPPNILLPAGYDIVWSLVVFVVIGILFWKFFLPKFIEVLSEREDRIKGGIQRAEAVQAEAKAALEKYNSQLAEARAEAAEIREEARNRGKQIEAEAVAAANEQSARIIESGEKQLAAQREQVIAELRREMGQNSITLAERLLGDHLSDEAKRSGTIDKFLADLDSITPAGK
ncbi:F0F1 ATP synthase subunit B [Corynebacterium kutscheri]|uniref:ATP synthase subunit b n=1 Tax=Corynebacterium kutscheri TaxID=35755 RepID=A0A0F6TDD8_9CORY|nr:F0F1 ATP synthase subunit B [Corynebacterium kutscheri]AKE41641.1 ATP synthase, F0 subunit b [Corynebacterium kutscheri]VEH08917.1 F0F1 ATP synthase subunit B [Corynebacterium kutscheri]VEH09968.1 F0F1 ATP synthase subunit B [Corynebacterium kutscheri]VEH80047.1 F0F1 ATP synthase subunit B [Corynebacterium kutscheri]